MLVKGATGGRDGKGMEYTAIFWMKKYGDSFRSSAYIIEVME